MAQTDTGEAVETTPDGVPLTPDVPDRLATPPGVPDEETIWYDYGGGVDPEDARTYALFSGGDDSLASTYLAMKGDVADAVLYLNTNTGLAANLEYVKEACSRYGWDLRVERSPVPLVEVGMKFGFPGSGFHGLAYAYFKERQLSRVAGEFDDAPTFVTGVRKRESDRRMENVGGDGYSSEGKGGRWTWKRIISEWSDEDVADYRERVGLPRNPVAEKIHRSGDCYCGAYAHRDELLIDLYAHGFDRHATWLRAVETRVQEYRGRVSMFRKWHNDAYEEVEEYRDDYNPKPMFLPTAREFYPELATAVEEESFSKAVEWGRRDERNYWGHGNMDSDELQHLVAEENPEQAELCQFCEIDDDGL